MAGKPQIFQARVQSNGLFEFLCPKAVMEYLTKNFAEKLVDVSFAFPKKHKTQRQLGAWFGLFCKMVLADFEDNGVDTSYLFKLEKPTGIEVSEGLLKDYMYSMCPTFNDEGQRLTMSKMDTAQMAKFFDACRNFASSQWSIFVPEPNPNWNKTTKKVTE